MDFNKMSNEEAADWIMGKFDELPDTDPEPALVAMTDQIRADVVAMLNSMVKEIREHKGGGCVEQMCIGTPAMAATTVMMLKDPKTILLALWAAVDRLSSLPDPQEEEIFRADSA